MEPAKTIIDRLGGPQAVHEITGAHITRVYCWMRHKRDGGTGGHIPARHVPKLLAAAKDRHISLSAEEFFPQAAA